MTLFIRPTAAGGDTELPLAVNVSMLTDLAVARRPARGSTETDTWDVVGYFPASFMGPKQDNEVPLGVDYPTEAKALERLDDLVRLVLAVDA